MPELRVLAAALASSLLIALPVAAVAQTTRGAAAEHESKAEHENKTELKAFEAAKVPLTDAIKAAETHSGGKALDVSFEENRGKPVFKVKTYQNNAVWEGMIDAQSGQLVGQGKTVPESQLDQEDKAELAGLRNAKASLADAVKAAEQHLGGKAIDAGLEEAGGAVAYEIEIVKNGAVQKAMVDPGTGKLTSGQARSGSSTRR